MPKTRDTLAFSGWYLRFAFKTALCYSVGAAGFWAFATGRTTQLFSMKEPTQNERNEVCTS